MSPRAMVLSPPSSKVRTPGEHEGGDWSLAFRTGGPPSRQKESPVMVGAVHPYVSRAWQIPLVRPLADFSLGRPTISNRLNRT